MECSCSINAGIDDYSEILKEKWVTARKHYQCCECFRQIQPGEKYYIETALYDGTIDTFKTCGDCLSIRNNLMGDFCWKQVRETVKDALLDCDGQLPEKCMSKLTPAAREWVCEIIEDVWERTE